jgi:hypothetical protein
MQLRGIGKFGPVYYLAEYLRTPLSKFLLGINYNLDLINVKTFLPAMVVGYYLPTIAQFVAPLLRQRHTYNECTLAIIPSDCTTDPSFSSTFNEELVSAAVGKDNQEQVNRRKHNMFYVHCAYMSFALISGLTFLHARATKHEVPFFRLFIPNQMC